MTTGGEGGMFTTNDEALWQRAWSFKDHGKSWDAVYNRQHPPGFRWVHDSFGTNWRITEMQSVLGRAQLRRLDSWRERRQALAARIDEVAARFVSVRSPRPDGGICHARYKHYLFVDPAQLAAGWTRDRIIDALAEQKVPCYQGSCSEVYLEKAFDYTDWRPAQSLPVARELGETSLMFLVHPTITDEQMDQVCRVLASVLEEATR